MRLYGLLDDLPLWGLFAAHGGGRLLSFESRFPGRQVEESPVGTRSRRWWFARMVGAMLGLVTFILAFTFWIAAAHFEPRRQSILNEANAIRTAYLRADLLPEPHRAEIRNLLREYVDIRLEGRSVGEYQSSDCAVGRVTQPCSGLRRSPQEKRSQARSMPDISSSR